MAKKESVHLKLSKELEGIDAELDKAMEALSEASLRIDAFLDGEEAREVETEIPAVEADEPMKQEEVPAAKSDTDVAH
jgi:hypothetical protein